MKLSFTRNIILRVLMIIAVLAGGTAGAQSIRNSVDKKDILIGQQISYKLSISIPSPDFRVTVNIPDSIPHFDVLGKTGVISKDKQNKYTWETGLLLTSFDSGSWTIPAFSYRINHLNTASQVLNTDSFRINVGYMPTDASNKPRDIKSILEVNFFNWFWINVTVTVLALLMILFFIYKHFSSLEKKKAPKESRTAFDDAMQALAELRKANGENALPVKEFHTKLADVVKTYYSNRLSGNFKNKTTGEILNQLKRYELKAETESNAAAALETGDAVKFAKYHSTYAENEAAVNYLKEVIEETEHSLSKKI